MIGGAQGGVQGGASGGGRDIWSGDSAPSAPSGKQHGNSTVTVLGQIVDVLRDCAVDKVGNGEKDERDRWKRTEGERKEEI